MLVESTEQVVLTLPKEQRLWWKRMFTHLPLSQGILQRGMGITTSSQALECPADCDDLGSKSRKTA